MKNCNNIKSGRNNYNILFFCFIGFDDAFRAIERLSMYVFDLPVDTAVKQFKDMNEAF